MLIEVRHISFFYLPFTILVYVIDKLCSFKINKKSYGKLTLEAHKINK